MNTDMIYKRLPNKIAGIRIYPPLRKASILLVLTISYLCIELSTTADAFAYGALEIATQQNKLSHRKLSLQLYAPKEDQPDTVDHSFILAHAIVVKTSPPQGGTASGNIGKVDVWYDAGIRDSLAALAVVSATGERVDKRDAAIDSADPAHVSVGVNQMTPGKYTVRYRALSADGHMVSGAWEFDVQP